MACSVTTTETIVLARPLPGSVGSDGSAHTALCASSYAPRVAEFGSSCRRSASTRCSRAVNAAVAEAVSGLYEVDTPSQTTATTVEASPVTPSTAKAMSSSLRECRRPRSVTPATGPRSRSTRSRGSGSGLPHTSQ
jgi:hypothetical protein